VTVKEHGVSELLLHNFPENGVKFLLHNPGNLGDLTRMLASRYKTLPDPSGFDFAARTIEPDTLIRSDFSHGVTDLLVRLPFQVGGQATEWIKVYLLFEHLSGHQRHIVPRSLGYAMDAYRVQERRWREQHDSLDNFLYEVVVPIVIYTGERTWQAPTPFRDLVQGGNEFSAFIPSTEPLFLSLPAETEQSLLQDGGTLGAVLHVLQQRKAAIEQFQLLLMNAARTVEGQLPNDYHRLRELLAYLMALVYHFREKNERNELRNDLERSIEAPATRKEVSKMGQTIAEALREEGELKGELKGTLKGKRQMLLQLLQRKFGPNVTPAIIAGVEKTVDHRKLDEWAGKIIDAQTLEEFDIP
jgi:Putative transposase, YhgA-like